MLRLKNCTASDIESPGNGAFIMTNKYLTKIAETVDISDKLRNEDKIRSMGKSFAYSAAATGMGAIVQRRLGIRPGSRYNGLIPAVGAISGAIGGGNSSRKNQLREQQVHDIKLQGAAQRNETHNLRVQALRKHASESNDPNQGKKDLVNTGVIAGLGGVGTLATDKLMPSVAKAFPNVGRKTRLGVLGVGIGLAADYAGLKAKPHIDNQIDKI
jgi:hypothetical protein